MGGNGASPSGRLASKALPASRRRHDEPAGTVVRRRRAVALTLMIGTVLLGLAIAQEPGSTAFYPFTLAAAGSWAVGALVSGPLHLGGRRLAIPLALGAAAFVAFAVAAVLVRLIPALDEAVGDVLAYADNGRLAFVVTVALATGAAEELFFRGALYSALSGHRPVLGSTAAYVAVTAVATQNLALVLAAGAMGLLFGLQRRATGGILAPVLTHLTWSVLMILLLPR